MPAPPPTTNDDDGLRKHAMRTPTALRLFAHYLRNMLLSEDWDVLLGLAEKYAKPVLPPGDVGSEGQGAGRAAGAGVPRGPGIPPRAKREERRRRLLEALDAVAARAGGDDDGCGDDQVARNAAFAAEELRLDELDREILLLRCQYDRIEELQEFAQAALNRLRSVSRTIAAMLGSTQGKVHARLIPGGALADNGVLTLDPTHRAFSLGIELAAPLRKAMQRPHAARADWVATVLGRPCAASLAWEDHAHLGAQGALAARALAGHGEPPRASPAAGRRRSTRPCAA